MPIEAQVENLREMIKSLRNDHNKLVTDVAEKLFEMHQALTGYDGDSKKWREDRQAIFAKLTAIEAVLRGTGNLLDAHFMKPEK